MGFTTVGIDSGYNYSFLTIPTAHILEVSSTLFRRNVIPFFGGEVS